MGGCCSHTVEHAEEEPGDVRPDFEPVQQLGRHDVWLCTCNASHDKMVIKLMQRPLSDQQAKFLADELLAQCRQGPGHVNLVKPRELVLTPRHLGFAMEYVRGGSLQQYVRGRPADEDLACYLFRQLLWLITYCTDNHVPNRDIKLDRLLLDTSRPPRLLLADFGVVKAAQALGGSAATPPATYFGPDQLHSLLFAPPSQTPHPAGPGRDDPDSSQPTATPHAAQQGIRTMSSSRPQADKSGAAVGHPPPLPPRGPDPAPGAAALDSPFTRLLAASTAAALLGSSHPPSDSPPLQPPAAGSAQAPSEPSQGRRGGQEQAAARITLSRSPSSAAEGHSTAWSRRFNSGVPQGVVEAAVAALAAEGAAEHEPQAGCTVPLLAQQVEVQRGGEAGKAAQQAGLAPVAPAPPTYSAVAHDVWAAGVVLATMLLGANPFSFDDKAGFGEMRDAAVRAYQPDHHLAWRQQLVARMSRGRVSEEAQDLVLAMLAREGEERLGVQLILEHPWMARTLAPQYELALEDLLACQDEVTERQRLGHYLASQREQDVRNMLALAQQPPPPPPPPHPAEPSQLPHSHQASAAPPQLLPGSGQPSLVTRIRLTVTAQAYILDLDHSKQLDTTLHMIRASATNIANPLKPRPQLGRGSDNGLLARRSQPLPLASTPNLTLSQDAAQHTASPPNSSLAPDSSPTLMGPQPAGRPGGQGQLAFGSPPTSRGDMVPLAAGGGAVGLGAVGSAADTHTLAGLAKDPATSTPFGRSSFVGSWQGGSECGDSGAGEVGGLSSPSGLASPGTPPTPSTLSSSFRSVEGGGLRPGLHEPGLLQGLLVKLSKLVGQGPEGRPGRRSRQGGRREADVSGSGPGEQSGLARDSQGLLSGQGGGGRAPALEQVPEEHDSGTDSPWEGPGPGPGPQQADPGRKPHANASLAPSLGVQGEGAGDGGRAAQEEALSMQQLLNKFHLGEPQGSAATQRRTERKWQFGSLETINSVADSGEPGSSVGEPDGSVTAGTAAMTRTSLVHSRSGRTSGTELQFGRLTDLSRFSAVSTNSVALSPQGTPSPHVVARSSGSDSHMPGSATAPSGLDSLADDMAGPLSAEPRSGSRGAVDGEPKPCVSDDGDPRPRLYVSGSSGGGSPPDLAMLGPVAVWEPPPALGLPQGSNQAWGQAAGQAAGQGVRAEVGSSPSQAPCGEGESTTKDAAPVGGRSREAGGSAEGGR